VATSRFVEVSRPYAAMSWGLARQASNHPGFLAYSAATREQWSGGGRSGGHVTGWWSSKTSRRDPSGGRRTQERAAGGGRATGGPHWNALIPVGCRASARARRKSSSSGTQVAYRAPCAFKHVVDELFWLPFPTVCLETACFERG